MDRKDIIDAVADTIRANTSVPVYVDNEPTCYSCGAPATHSARDIMRHEPIGDMYASFSPVGDVVYGCDKHPVQSTEHRTQMPEPH